MSGASRLCGGETLTSSRYLSQVRQELAIRLLQRVYMGGNTPSKVWLQCSRNWDWANGVPTVVAEFHEAEIYGQIALSVSEHCF